MGLFDKLKKSNQESSKATQNMEQLTTQNITSNKEDFSELTDLQVLEKIDQYNNDVKESANNANYEKLSNVIDEFDKRFNNMPLSKRGTISQDWSFLKVQKGNILQMMQVAPAMVNTMADQISGYVAKIYTELSK